jgi:hypothetical protein
LKFIHINYIYSYIIKYIYIILYQFFVLGNIITEKCILYYFYNNIEIYLLNIFCF